MTDERFIEASGTARERGEQQGRAFAPDVAGHIDALLRCFRARGSADPRAYLDEFVTRTRFLDTIELHMPHLLEEVRGLADGAGVEFELAYVLQLMDEEWAYRAGCYGGRPLQKCSSFAIRNTAAGETWIGQNMDLGGYTDGLQKLVLHRPTERPEMLVFTIAGVLALLGVNRSGVGVCVNSLPQLPSAPEGIPVAFMIRRLLEASSAGEASELCRSLPHATNQHYLIADPETIVSLECSAAGVTQYRPRDPDRILHTNHPLAGHPVDKQEERNSVSRLNSLESRLSEGEARLGAMRAALSAFDDPENPVCRLKSGESGTINFTTGSMISALRGAAAQIESWVSFGPPSERGYGRFAFRESCPAA